MARGPDDEQRAGVIAGIADDLARVVLDDLAPTMAAYRRETERRLGLDATELLFLDLLRRLGPLSSATLATRAGITRSAVSKALRRLESEAHIRRETTSEHRQEVFAVLVDHPERDRLLDAQRRRLRQRILRLADAERLDRPERLALLTRWNALVREALHARAQALADRVAAERHLEHRRLAEARRAER